MKNKNLIFSGLMLFILTLLVLSPAPAKAYYFVGWQGDNYVGYPINNGSGNNGSNNNYNNPSNPIPYVNSITPNSTKVNTGSTIIMVYGYNFVQGSVVRWGNTDKPTTFVDSGTLRAQLDYYDLNNPGNHQVSVYNPIPGGGFSNSVSFTIYQNVISTGTTGKTNTGNTTNSNVTGSANDKSTDGKVSDLAAGAIFGSNAFMPSSLLQWIFFAILILLAVILWRRLYVSEDEKKAPLKHA